MNYLQETILFSLIILQFLPTNGQIQPATKWIKSQENEEVWKAAWTPDEYLDAAQIIRRYGYPSETHTVQTDDGYLLTLHRIPGDKTGKPGRQPVFLQHGLLSSSVDWVDAGNQSLGFMLADQGYDVWMGNARGNTYSKGHVTMSLKNGKYWDFTWHEMAMHDLPAAFKYVNKITQKPGEMLYVGHSMGTTMFFVYASMNQEAAKNIKLMVALAPVGYMTHIKSPIKYLAPFVDDLEFIANHLGMNEFMPSNSILKLLSYECESLNVDKRICENLMFILLGINKDEFNRDLLNVVLSHVPAGTSTKTALHYCQEIKHSGDFRQYDYGVIENKIKYGSITPPSYNVTNIRVPTYFMYASNDWLAAPLDVERLSTQIETMTGMYKVPNEQFDHVAFLFGKHAPELINKPIIDLFQGYKMTD